MPRIPEDKPVSGLVASLSESARNMTQDGFLPTEAVWKGPESSCDLAGGITNSLLGKFITCRERFRISTILGVKSKERFNKSIEFGNMWHICEEMYAGGKDWRQPLANYCNKLTTTYIYDVEEVKKWFQVIIRQFPRYIEHYKDTHNPEFQTRLLQEEAFKVPYRLPNGRVVYLRGKWDCIDVDRDRDSDKLGIILQENKTKGDYDEIQLQRQLDFDCQTMLYVTALTEYMQNGVFDMTPKMLEFKNVPIYAIRYNVIRRPFGGPKGNIRKHAPTKKNPMGETDDEFFDRLDRDYLSVDPFYYFTRFKVKLQPGDITRFRNHFLDAILTQLCEWYEWITSPLGKRNPFGNPIHWRHPFGLYNSVDDRGTSSVDEFMNSRSMIGMEITTDLFPELRKA